MVAERTLSDPSPSTPLPRQRNDRNPKSEFGDAQEEMFYFEAPESAEPKKTNAQHSEIFMAQDVFIVAEFDDQIDQDKIQFSEQLRKLSSTATIVPTTKNIQGKWKGGGMGVGAGIGGGIGFVVGGAVGFVVLGGVGAIVGRAIGKKKGQAQEKKYLSTQDLTNLRSFLKPIKCKAPRCSACSKKFHPPIESRSHCGLCGSSFCAPHIVRRAYVKYEEEKNLKYAKICEDCWKANTPENLHPLPLPTASVGESLNRRFSFSNPSRDSFPASQSPPELSPPLPSPPRTSTSWAPPSRAFSSPPEQTHYQHPLSHSESSFRFIPSSIRDSFTSLRSSTSSVFSKSTPTSPLLERK